MSELASTSTIRSIAQCLAAYGRHLAVTRGRRVCESNGVVMCAAGLASFRNMVVPLRPMSERDVADLARRVADFFGSPTGWVIWNVFPLDLTVAGFSSASVTNIIMARPPQPPPFPAGAHGLVIHEVETDDDVATFERVRGMANHLASSLYGMAPRLDVRALGGGHRMWLGSVAGRPIATAASFDACGVNMVKNVSTHPAFRRRGIGTAMSLHAVARSDNPAVLDADPGADHIYRRLGFTEAGTLNFWHGPVHDGETRRP